MRISHKKVYDIGGTTFKEVSEYIEKNKLEAIYDKLEFHFIDFNEYIEFTQDNKTNLEKYKEYIIYKIGRILDVDNFTVELEVDNEINHLVNLNELKIKEQSVFIQTLFFNVKLNSIAKFYNTYGLDLINANVRDNLVEVDIKKLMFEKTLKENPDAFYLYNNGVNLITENGIRNKKNKLVLENQNVQIVNGAQTIGSFLRYKKSLANEAEVYVPLRLNIINYPKNIESSQEKKEIFDEVCREISIKVNSQKEISIFDIKQKELETMHILDKIILVDQDRAQETKNFVRDFSHIVLSKPGTIKNSLKKIINDPICYKLDDENEQLEITNNLIQIDLEYLKEKNYVFFKEEYNLSSNNTLEIPDGKARQVTFTTNEKNVLFDESGLSPLSFYEMFANLSTTELVKIRKEIEANGILSDYPYITNHLISILYRKRRNMFMSESDIVDELEKSIQLFYDFSDTLYKYLEYILVNMNHCEPVCEYLNWVKNLKRIPQKLTKIGKGHIKKINEELADVNDRYIEHIDMLQIADLLSDKTMVFILNQLFKRIKFEEGNPDYSMLEQEYYEILAKRNLYLQDETLEFILHIDSKCKINYEYENGIAVRV